MTDKPKLKQTEVGMIPSDWEVKTLGELVDMSSGTTPSRFNEKNFQGNVCWLSSGELKSHYIYNTKEKISEDAASSMRLYPKGTVVIAMYGLEAEGVRGTSSILAKECTISQACMAFTNLREINNEYFYYWYAANGNEIGTKYAQGTKQQNLSPEVMKNVIIPLPPTIEEQQRIANALSDVDTLIANLEKLIAKKKNIKQGAMQQLLTGKKRLPGFAPAKPTYKQTELGKIPTDWEVKNVGKLLKIGHGRDYKNLKSGNVPVYGTGGYMTSVNDCLYDGETVCIGRKGTIDKPFYHTGKIWTVDTLFYTYGFNNCNPKFIYYAFCLVDWFAMNEASGVPSLTSKNIEDVLLRIPSSKAEQTAIANILSDMDTEISALETKLAKYRTLKTGMMQQLLTGKVRLK